MKGFLKYILPLTLLVFLASGLMSQTVTFGDDVAPIIKKHCVSCHQKGQAVPFTFTNYKTVVRHKELIGIVTRERVMPPWPADPDYRHFQNENRLSREEIKTIQNWISGGCVKGKDVNLSNSKKKCHKKNSQVSEGRIMEFSAKESLMVPGTGKDHFVYLIIDPETEDTLHIKSFEFIPGNLEIVHHTELLIGDRTPKDPEVGRVVWDSAYYSGLFQKSFSDGYQYITGWLPGNQGQFFPVGSGISIPPGKMWIMMIHYAPSTQGLEDQTKLRIELSEKAAERPMESFDLHAGEDIASGLLVIPPDTVITFYSTKKTEEDMLAFSIFPHAHHLCDSMDIYATTPDGDTIPLLNIPKWDFDWQLNYDLSEYLFLPKGTQVHYYATFDNTANNPENPFHPPRTIYSSFNSDDEMMELFIWNLPFEKELMGQPVILQK